ncbi:MAG: hypothetical protein QOJ37_2868 [Pseudonocardiales bacterium]|nr:hypothetical protein [Pseudonocardiales bacterium]
MKVLVDAVGCGNGGISTYVVNLLRHWHVEFPDDELRVLLGDQDMQVARPGVTVSRVSVPRPDLLWRPVVETRAVRRIARTWRPDAIIAARPSTTLLGVDVPLVVVVHDLRHELRPEQFPASRRAIRTLSYRRAYAVARGYVCISQRTLTDFHNLHPRLRSRPAVVVHHGADHVADWPRTSVEPYVIAFGHHSNKNVQMVLEAWRDLIAAGVVTASTPRLNIVGLTEQSRTELDGLVGDLGIRAHVVLSPYLADDDFHALMVGCAVVLFPSDFEGFGLPVVEGMQLGKPVVVGPDEAIREVAQGHATMMAGFTAPALADAIRAALSESPEAIAAARDYAASFTWARAARQTREFLLTLG